jgi:hypothetical protein
VAEDANILGPRLHTFSWVFTSRAVIRAGRWDDFHAADARWLRRLVEVAVARKAALRTVRIQFAPDDICDTTEERCICGDLMDDVRD